MAEAGIDVRYDSSRIAVIGVVEVLKHYGEIRRALTLMRRIVKDERPDLLVCVDYKEFNFKLAKYAKKLGIKHLQKVKISSKRGSIVLPVDLNGRGKSEKGNIFVAFFDETKLINELCIDAYCPISGEPDFKKCAVKVEKA